MEFSSSIVKSFKRDRLGEEDNYNSASWVADYKHGLKPRDRIFKDALEFLQPDHKTQVISIVGMGGVGKTAMVEQLRKVVADRNMFDWIVKVAVGQRGNMFSIQKAIAECVSQPLTETNKTRAECLRTRFEEISKGKKVVLVILDDVWETVELNDIGLNPLPNGFKLLLTSRDADVCRKTGREANLDGEVLIMGALDPLELGTSFWGITGISEEYDPELYQIGCAIIIRCSGLPSLINIIAATLKSQDKLVWRNTLRHLTQSHSDYPLFECMKIGYNNLEKEERMIFLLCGLFREDSSISVADLAKYAWSLKLFDDVATVEDARDRTKTCVHNLIDASLLIDDGDELGCIKTHDIVHDFLSIMISRHGISLLINPRDV